MLGQNNNNKKNSLTQSCMSLCYTLNCFVYMIFLFLQATVEQINIEGYWRTKRDILIPGIKRLLKATTFSEVILLVIKQSDTT